MVVDCLFVVLIVEPGLLDEGPHLIAGHGLYVVHQIEHVDVVLMDQQVGLQLFVDLVQLHLLPILKEQVDLSSSRHESQEVIIGENVSPTASNHCSDVQRNFSPLENPELEDWIVQCLTAGLKTANIHSFVRGEY